MTDPVQYPNSTAVFRAFDDVPEHLFRVDGVQDSYITGVT